MYPYLGYQRGCVASGDGFGSRVRTRHGAVSEGSIINFARVVRQRARSKDFYRGSDPIHSIHRARWNSLIGFEKKDDKEGVERRDCAKSETR